MNNSNINKANNSSSNSIGNGEYQSHWGDRSLYFAQKQRKIQLIEEERLKEVKKFSYLVVDNKTNKVIEILDDKIGEKMYNNSSHTSSSSTTTSSCHSSDSKVIRGYIVQGIASVSYIPYPPPLIFEHCKILVNGIQPLPYTEIRRLILICGGECKPYVSLGGYTQVSIKKKNVEYKRNKENVKKDSEIIEETNHIKVENSIKKEEGNIEVNKEKKIRIEEENERISLNPLFWATHFLTTTLNSSQIKQFTKTFSSSSSFSFSSSSISQIKQGRLPHFVSPQWFLSSLAVLTRLNERDPSYLPLGLKNQLKNPKGLEDWVRFEPEKDDEREKERLRERKLREQEEIEREEEELKRALASSLLSSSSSSSTIYNSPIVLFDDSQEDLDHEFTLPPLKKSNLSSSYTSTSSSLLSAPLVFDLVEPSQDFIEILDSSTPLEENVEEKLDNENEEDREKKKNYLLIRKIHRFLLYLEDEENDYGGDELEEESIRKNYIEDEEEIKLIKEKERKDEEEERKKLILIKNSFQLLKKLNEEKEKIIEKLNEYEPFILSYLDSLPIQQIYEEFYIQNNDIMNKNEQISIEIEKNQIIDNNNKIHIKNNHFDSSLLFFNFLSFELQIMIVDLYNDIKKFIKKYCFLFDWLKKNENYYLVSFFIFLLYNPLIYIIIYIFLFQFLIFSNFFHLFLAANANKFFSKESSYFYLSPFSFRT